MSIDRSLYIEKYIDHVIILQNSETNIDTTALVKRYLPDGYFHVPTMLGKTQRFYEKILIETGSAKIQYNFRRARNREEYAFFKIMLEKVITLEDWVHTQNPFQKILLPKIF